MSDAPTTTANRGPDNSPKRPQIKVPAGACDSHIHIFGPERQYPFVRNAAYRAPDATPADYLQLMQRLGLTRAVIVHPAAIGTDNRRTLDAMADHPALFRGIIIPSDGLNGAALRDLDRRGVRGIRFSSVGGQAGQQTIDQGLASHLADLGWHAQVHVENAQILDLETIIRKLPCDAVIDHMARIPAAWGIGHPAFRCLLSLVETGRVWVKLSAPMRYSAADRPPYADVTPMARALAAAAPDRMLWGTDWPHVHFNRGIIPNDADLLDLLAVWVPDAAVRQRILVDNPARLYRF